MQIGMNNSGRVFSTICDTPLWDSQISWNTTEPRLTSCLIETLFVWIPSAFLWLCIPYLIFYNIRSNVNPIPWSGYNISRLIVSALLTIVTLIDFIACLLREFRYDNSPTNAHLLSTAIYFITRLAISLILYYQRVSGIHCSGIVFFYLLMETVLGAMTTASYSLEPLRLRHEYILHVIEYSLTVILFLFCCFADRLPPNTYKQKPDSEDKVCPKYSASIPSKLTFWWITGLIIKGWKNSLTEDDLWVVRKEDRSTNVFKYFNKYWKGAHMKASDNVDLGDKGDTSYKDQSIQNSGQTSGNSNKTKLLSIITKTFWLYFLTPNLLKLVADISQLLSPLIMKLLISFTTGDEPFWHGYIYAVLFLLINFFQSFINGYHSQQMCVLGMRIRTCLISAVYRKSLILSSCAKKDTTTGEIVNLMSVDSQRFIDLLPYLSFVFTTPILVGIALWQLYNELGMAVFGGLVVILLCIPINGYVSAWVKNIQTKQMKLKDQRLRGIDEILNGIKILKLYGWEEAFVQKILAIRKKELHLIKKSGFVYSIVVMLATCSPFFVSLVTFAIYIIIDAQNNILDAQKVFVSIALFNLMRFPLIMLPDTITNLVLTLVSVKRLEKFLNSSELIPYVTRHSDQKEVVKIENGTFMWDRTDNVKEIKPILDKINLKIMKGKFVAVVGTVGSGKSSLLYALLGEMEKCSGSVNISSDAEIAYVPQQAWIQNATLKDNILFSKDVDEKKYQKVLRACALKQDLLTLAGGDHTEIGEKGINLSGGQKQRVSLARAVYSDSDLYLMDDPLSAVDSHVGKHILDEVLSSKTGLLHNKTRILVTNSLFVLPDVDYIVVLKNGRITDYGTYEELMAQKGDFAELINEYTTNDKTNDDSVTSQDSIEKRPSESTSNVLTDQQDSSKLVEVERAETGNVSFSIYKKFAQSMSLFWAVSMILGFAATYTANCGSTFWLSDWTADTSGNSNYGYRLGVYAALGIAQAITECYAWCSIISGTLLASRTLHRNLLLKIMHAPMHFFDTTPLGRILNRFSKDIDILDSTIQITLRVLQNSTFQTLTILVMISIQTPIFIAVCIPMLIIYVFIQKFYVKTSRQLKRMESITRSPIYSHFSETINGVSTIRAYGANDRFIQGSDNRVDANQVCFYPNAIANCWLSVRLEFLANCIIFFAALLAVLSKDSLMGEQIGLSLSYALNISLALNWAVRMFAEMENNVVAVERIDEYTQIESEADWYSANPPSKEWPVNGCVEFVEYGTRYREGLDLVIKGIDIKVEKGEKIGIVGRTGAGKSSLTLALFRLIEASFGRIVIDNIDISKIGLQELRSRLTIIPQDPVLFAGTIRTNLDPFESYTEEQIWTALEHSHLHEFVKGTDAGIYYKVSEGGENLSVGQRQLMCLARALLRNTNILILDEATAAVDLETDALIQTTIRNEFSGCTVLTIAHRLNTIMDSDRVLVLHEGRVAEFDSPLNLLKDDNTIFYSLAKDAGLV